VTILVLTANSLEVSSGSASPSLAGSRPFKIATAQHSRRDCKSSILPENGLANSIIKSLENGSRRILTSSLAASIPRSAVLVSSPATSHRRSLSPPDSNNALSHGTLPVTAMKEVLKIPPLLVSKLRARNPPKNTGFYYGLQPDKIFPYDSTAHRAEQETKAQQLAMADAMSEALEEMKSMRKELQLLRREMYEMRKKITGEKNLEFEDSFVRQEEVDPEKARLAKFQRQRKFDRLGKEVEDWARQLLFEEERAGNGWTEVPCNRMLARTVNPDGRTTCFVGWMKDPRGADAFPDDDREYPAVKVYSTIDGPLEDVCTYLSRPEHMTDYNHILTEYRDLEEISPHSKLSCAVSPQVLFIKPREFVSFLHHRWLRDGSVVMVNQAVEHKDAPAVTDEGRGKACRAYALRGATFISPDPDDPYNKTRFAMIAHAAPGGGLPQWMTKTGMNAVAPSEPFRLFHQINQCLAKAKPKLERIKLEHAKHVAIPGHSNQPVGFASIGFAAFWPNGGGLLPLEPSVSSEQADTSLQPRTEADTVTSDAS